MSESESAASSSLPQHNHPLPKPAVQTANSSLDSAHETSSDPISIYSPQSSVADENGPTQLASAMMLPLTPWKLGSTVLSSQSKYHEMLLNQSSGSVEAVLASTCEVMGFHIAELWLRTGSKTHQLINTHLRPSILEDSVRKNLNDVYYGEQSSERTHRLSPSLCKRAKENSDVVWVSSDTSVGREMLRYSISNVHTAVAVPISHESSNTNMTVIFFSMRKVQPQPAAMEFFVHLSLAAGVASVNGVLLGTTFTGQTEDSDARPRENLSRSENPSTGGTHRIHQLPENASLITGAPLNLQWRTLANVEYLTDGGNSWIHSAVYNGKPVIIKTLKPECQDLVLAINEIESELALHSRLTHEHVVSMIGAGTTSKGVRFIVLERLDGGTLAQMLGYDTRIRDRRRRFWRRKQFSFLDVLRTGTAIASAMSYLHEDAIPGCTVLHRDLKPDNIGFTLEGTVKVFDFGLARILENATTDTDEVYEMSGETGSLRYMAPEVADGLPYNFKADVYSFGIILWELVAGKKPFDGLNRDLFYERVVHGGERPIIRSKWPKELSTLMAQCWDADIHNRPTFREIAATLTSLLDKEKGGIVKSTRQLLPRIGNMIDRHSTWF